MTPANPRASIVSSNTNTCWVFVAGAADPRHLFDIIFCVHVLRTRGVPDSSIRVFTDHPATSAHLSPFGISSVLPTRLVTTELASLSGFELLVVVVTGHGDPAGISVKEAVSINPTELITSARSCPGIRGGVIVLGQCFAGVFNYTDAGLDPEKTPLCLVGATSLNPSLSNTLRLPTAVKTLDGSGALTEWQANIFIVRFFEWLLAPQDVDGDGRWTLMDAYKHASAMSNRDLRQGKRESHHRVAQIQADLAQPTPALPLQQQLLSLLALRQNLDMAFEILYLHQEPWVLNAIFAREIEFPLPQRPTAPESPLA